MTVPVGVAAALVALGVVVSACTTTAADPADRPVVGVTLPEVGPDDRTETAGAEPEETDAGARSVGFRPESVVVAGDSIALGLGTFLREALDDDVDVELVAEEGTGLAFPNGRDWPETVEEIAAADPPSVLVFSVGTNDDQNLLDEDGSIVAERDSARWDDEYERRLERVFDAFADTDTDTEIWWVGHVCTSRDDVCDTNREIHALAVEVAEERPWVVIADLGELLDVGDDVPTDCLTSDGVHIEATCLEEAAVDLLDELAPAARRPDTSDDASSDDESSVDD